MDEQRKSLTAQRIKSCRLEKKLSQDKLAELLGMKRTNIANYEAGRITPPGNVLSKMADEFDVTVDYILGKTDYPKSSSEFDELLNDPNTNMMFNDWITMSEEQREEAIRMIKYVLLNKKK